MQITKFATEHGITRSMGYTGICRDDALAESFFATLKTEFYHRRVWPIRARAIQGVSAWIEDRYNRCGRRLSIGHVTPVDFEMQYSSTGHRDPTRRLTRVHSPGSTPTRKRHPLHKPSDPLRSQWLAHDWLQLSVATLTSDRAGRDAVHDVPLKDDV